MEKKKKRGVLQKAEGGSEKVNYIVNLCVCVCVVYSNGLLRMVVQLSFRHPTWPLTPPLTHYPNYQLSHQQLTTHTHRHTHTHTHTPHLVCVQSTCETAAVTGSTYGVFAYDASSRSSASPWIFVYICVCVCVCILKKWMSSWVCLWWKYSSQSWVAAQWKLSSSDFFSCSYKNNLSLNYLWSAGFLLLMLLHLLFLPESSL